MNGRMDEWMRDRWMEGWMDGWMDGGWMDKSSLRKPHTSQYIPGNLLSHGKY